ncbi:MAG: hypothetical protein E6J64_22410, partial [Deltaproteobacteria bacterium]
MRESSRAFTSAGSMWATSSSVRAICRLRRRMPEVAVVSDTTAYLPSEVTEENGISLVSLYVNFGAGDTQREADIRDYAAFFDRLRSANEWPTTS